MDNLREKMKKAVDFLDSLTEAPEASVLDC